MSKKASDTKNNHPLAASLLWGGFDLDTMVVREMLLQKL